MSIARRRAIAAGMLSALLALSAPVAAFAEDVPANGVPTGAGSITPTNVVPNGADATTPAAAKVHTYDEGMFGFFESVGATDALNILTTSKYASYTHKGEATDATSLANVSRTFDLLRECNDLRRQHNVGELKVSDRLMAIAESDTNWSDANQDHARQYNVGENLAWGYIDPFSGWYSFEKMVYEATGDEATAGHYFNIINERYAVTGFAVNTRATTGGTTYGQVFDYSPQAEETLYTVDEYEQRFLNYCKTVQVPMLRVYNKWSGEHHYTYSTVERDGLVAAGWTDEGTGWNAPAYSSAPVYRLYNKWSGDHHYTTSKTEYDELGKAGWTQEGVGWYSDDAKGTTLYRLFNPYVTIGTHHYTTSTSERNAMIAAGWKDEGIGWYGLK